MKQMQYTDVEIGKRYKVAQYYSTGTVITTEGTVTAKQDKYLYIAHAGQINVHAYVGMPNVYIYEV